MMDKNIEMLIEEIEKRPDLFDKRSKEYSNVIIKKKLWEEVCAQVVPDWNLLEKASQMGASNDIQNKWQNLRNCFARELRLQRQGNASKKRRKYIYFDKLLFLLPSMKSRNTTSNLEDVHQKKPEGMRSDNDEASNDTAGTSISYRRSRKRSATSKDNFEDLLPKLMQERKAVDIDEDVNFCLSLVPFFRSLGEYQKMQAKIQIMKLLKSIRWPVGAVNNSNR